LSEPPSVIEGGFGTMENVVLEDAREKVKNQNGAPKNMATNRADYGRQSKLFIHSNLF
jgi:hypothetical protein